MSVSFSAEPTTPAQRCAETTVSSPVVTRLAGVPATTLDLVSVRTRELLAEHAELTGRLEALAAGLVDALFELVPHLDDDPSLRRRVLAGKRAVHGLQALPWDDTVRRQVRARLPAQPGASIDAWTERTAARAQVHERLRDHLSAERDTAIGVLHDALADPVYLRSLAVVAPDWLRHARPDRRRSDSPRTVKTLLSYASRACVKTSPFSGLTTVGVAGAPGLGRARSRATGVLGLAALAVLARDERTAGLLRYRLIPLRRGGPSEPAGLVLHAENVFADGIVWRDDRVVEADHAGRWIRALQPADARGLTLDDVLARLGASGFSRFRRLLDAGVLQAIPPWRRDEDPLAVLAGLVDGAESPIPEARLRQVHDLGVATAGHDPAQRLAAAASVERLTRGWVDPADLGQHRPSSMIYEDRETDLDLMDPRAVPTVAADLRALGARMRPLVFRSHVYDLLVERFVAEVGPGGSCTDPLGLLMRAAVDRDSDPMLERAQAADFEARTDPGPRAWLPVGPTSSAPSSAVLFQLEADSAADVVAGRHRTVVNQFGAGSGALVARFSALLGRPLEAQLAEHVARCWPGVPCRELVVWTECNTAQAESSGMLPPLLVPGEPAAANGLNLEDTVLVHDASTDTLSLCTQDGEPFGLAYLGITPQHLLHGYLRLLGVLADPWINACTDCDYTLTQTPVLNAHRGADVAALPRVHHGRLVTRRACWVTPVSSLPRPDDAGDDAELALRLDAFRRTHDLPEEVFVHQLGIMGAPMAGLRKPVWVSLASPLSVRVFWAWLDPATTHVRIVEALPDRESYPQRDGAGRRRASEHAAPLCWPHPGGPA